MRMTLKKRILTVLCMGMAAAIALTAGGCASIRPPSSPMPEQTASFALEQTHSPALEETVPSEGGTLGEGATMFTLMVVNEEGQETHFQIYTDESTVGEALLKLGLIDGDESEYGLYVKTVNGITVDYDVDGKYWAFYVDGQYSSTGVDATDVVQGSTYSFKVE